MNFITWDPINIAIAVVLVMVFTIGSVIYARNVEDKATRIFYLFTVTILFWCVNMILFRSSTSEEMALIWSRLLYFSAPLIPFTFAYFVYRFPIQKKLNKAWHGFILPISLLVVSILSFLPTDIGLISEVAIRSSSENIILFNAIPYFIYSLFVSVLWGWTYIVLYRRSQTLSDEERKRSSMIVFYGVIISTVIAVVGNLLLPYSSVYAFNWTGQVGVIFMLSFTAYALVKYRLFDVRIITTEIFTFSLWIFLLIRLLTSEGSGDIIANSALLLATFIVGFFLIRSVRQEVKTREQIEELAKDLSKANERLKRLDEQKSEFLSIASHQFRSPLTAIRGYASMIMEDSYGEVPNKLKQPIGRILKSAENLTLVVNDFLNLSRIEQGRMKYEKEPVDLVEFVREAKEELEPNAQKKGLDLNLHHDEAKRYVSNIDIGKMRQVVLNLIDNSIKYTQEGQIDISLSKSEAGNENIIKVEDTGVGIPEDSIDKLFSQFKRASNANKVNVMGTGLGLYICKKIVEAHGGKIWAESKGEGEGAEFYVKLKATTD